MRRVHFNLQGKGGVGKTLAAVLLAQHYADKGDPAVCYDTDPVNDTLMGWKGLDPVRLELLDANDRIVERNFDQMMERILAEDRDFIVDCGAGAFLSMTSYLIENDVPAMIHENGKELFVHSVVVGGEAMKHTSEGFVNLADQMPKETQLVLWANAFFGPIQHGDRELEDMAFYKDNRERVRGVVRLDREATDTFREDLAQMLKARLTFTEAQASTDFGIMAKQRLRQLQRRYAERVAAVL